MPIFISFVLVLNSFIQISTAQIALQTAVSETAKQLATHMYPVKLLYKEAESQIVGNKTGAILQRVLDQIKQTRNKVTDSEDFAENYASYIPEPIMVLLECEKQKRELLETIGQDKSQEILDQAFNPMANKAFTDLMLKSTNPVILQPDHLKVIDVQLPNLALPEALIAIEAEYDIQLPIPFFHRTLALRKRAVEKAWIGS